MGGEVAARTRATRGWTRRLCGAIHLPGYITTLEAGVGTIMPSYSSWNGVKCSASKRLMTEILKEELGFEGFLISDYNALDQLDKDFKKAIEISINAGMDMVMVTGRYREYINNLTASVKEGKVPMSRIDDAVTRILRVKFAMGMMDKNRSQLADREAAGLVRIGRAPAVARDAVRQSLVLLKNEKKTLPISKKVKRIHVGRQECRRHRQPVRRVDHRLAGQERQHHDGRHHDSRRDQRRGLQRCAGDLRGRRVRSRGRRLGVVVIGEKPYAEMHGRPQGPLARQGRPAMPWPT